jgi:hypothetical protein
MPQGQHKVWYGMSAFMKRNEDIIFSSIAGQQGWGNGH